MPSHPNKKWHHTQTPPAFKHKCFTNLISEKPRPYNLFIYFFPFWLVSLFSWSLLLSNLHAHKHIDRHQMQFNTKKVCETLLHWWENNSNRQCWGFRCLFWHGLRLIITVIWLIGVHLSELLQNCIINRWLKRLPISSINFHREWKLSNLRPKFCLPCAHVLH